MSYFTDKELSKLREFCQFPFAVTSGYRCEAYNKMRGFTQTHATGQAVDIALTHKQAYIVISNAKKFGFTGLGVKQKGHGRFIHLDDLSELSHRPRPHIWSY